MYKLIFLIILSSCTKADLSIYDREYCYVEVMNSFSCNKFNLISSK